ncbi:serine/threonine-protein kinase RsbW [Amycolatopsis arida]|uniref:Serine/threonine-protein kinase RsbW n=1 Tax=Amycolatopsis arida TaxID=587909 RepID=A0A1I5XGW3_9PSEU|nr:hypothetical protein [Amycolatopsis arida]TDX97460.1 serine/threonine-protein kinase RsbW [Amycolatopsis arida]SFQ31195.1 serine/threonine-protein kinase RsbW [Amycolatopsis arida]
MTRVGVAEDLGTLFDSVVELSVRAEADQLVIPRAVAEMVAARSDFDLDAVADVKLAVDEACGALLAKSVLGGMLTCRFTLSIDVLTISVSSVASVPGVPGRGDFGWHVLRSLTDSVVARQGPPERGRAGFPTAIEFTKRKSA